MKITSFFSLRNYKYFYYLIKPFPEEVKKDFNSYSEFVNISALVDYINVKNYKKIVVVASGPSAKNVTLEKDALYFTTNNALKLVESVPHVYVLNDSYYILKYLKSISNSEEWKTTIFWYVSTTSKIKESAVKILENYFETRSRDKKEFLITNIDKPFMLKNIHVELVEFLKLNLDINYYGVNSGFVTLVLAYVISVISDIEIEIYGLDMGEKEEGYFDKKIELGKSIKGEKNREIVRSFLLKAYQSKAKIINHSNFMTYGINK